MEDDIDPECTLLSFGSQQYRHAPRPTPCVLSSAEAALFGPATVFTSSAMCFMLTPKAWNIVLRHDYNHIVAMK